jgi:hypothetical protein
MQAINKPQELQLHPGSIITLSKTTAKDFHEQMKSMIKDTGYGLFEYLEVVKFFEKVKDYISGNSQSKIEPDREIIDMAREEITKHNGKYTTPRGVKFENAETGTNYDFSKCNDDELLKLEEAAATIKDKIAERKEFLKTIPTKGLEVHTGDGNLNMIYPPSKSSKSGYKVTFVK